MTERAAASIPPKMLAQHADRLSALFDAHADRLYRLARRLVPSADDALDLVQDAFVRAARSPSSIPRGAREEEAWLVCILINVRRDQWRKEVVRKRHELNLSRAAGRQDDPERAFLIRTAVWRALDRLPPRRRAVVVMSELEGLSMGAIASLLGITTMTVRWHLSRGRRELARRLKFQLGESDEQPQKSLAGRRPAPSRSSAP
jgi:RNA polymerase sigma-70 factor (ECF subfamily)